MYQNLSGSVNNTLILKAKRNEIDFEKTITYSPSSYSMDVVIRQKNVTEKMVDLPGLTISLGSISLNKKHPEDASMEFKVINGDRITKINVARQMKEKISGDICAVRTRYQMYYFKTDRPVEFYVENKTSIINWGFHVPPSRIYGGQERKVPFVMYIGPSDYFVARNEINDIRVLAQVFLLQLGRFIFYILNAIHRIIPNWGFAVIILTILIKVIFFPLTRSSLRSMKQMQKLRPYLQDIQKKIQGLHSLCRRK